MPLPALVLGLAGLLPFLALSLQVAAGWPLSPRMTGPALYALKIYAAVILSFLGGVHWGLAMSRPPGAASQATWLSYCVSVLPALCGWGVVAWLDAPAGNRVALLALAAAFAALLACDLNAVAAGEAPRWYVRLRLVLTVVVVACLGAAAMFGPF
jgi:hypothetical protein